MKKRFVASLAVATTIGFLSPLTSHAFGLGQLDLQSALNQPFKAEIPVNALTSGESELLEVGLASSEEFDKAGLDRPFLLTKFKFEVVVTNGQTKILVTSKEAVKEPFLDFLLIATTGKGRLLREYTVLLDPPEFVLQETGLATKPASSSSSNQTTTSSTTTSTTKTSNTTSYSYASDKYKVQKLDTLWDVALKTKPSSDISVHQMMLALVDANPSAFRNQNINGLKAGKTLDIPSMDVIESRSLAQALAEVKQHNSQWKNRNKPAESTQQRVVANNSAAMDTAEVEPTEGAAATESNESAQVETEAKLNLLTPEDLETSNQDASTSTMGSSDVQKLAEQLTLAQETIEAQSQENVDLQQRMEALEDQIETLRRMISIKDADMARLQDVLGEDAEAVVDDGSANAEAAATGEQVVETEPTPQIDETATDEVASDEQVIVDDLLSESETDAEDKEAEFVATTAETLDIEPEEVQSIVDQVKAFLLEHKMEAGIGVLLVLVLLLILMRRREKDDFEEVELEEQEFHTEISSAPLQESAENIEEETSSVTIQAGTDKTAAELIDQADMFIGYADYVQAETSLNQARLREPDNQQAITKSLFVLYKQQHADAFAALLEESHIDKNSSDWKDIKAWGLELMPNNALFLDDAMVEQERSTESALGEDLNQAEDLTATADELEDDAAISLNLDDYVTDIDEPETQASSVRQNDVLEFDLGESLASEPELSVDAVEAEENDDIDFDLEAFPAAEAEELELDTDNTASFDLEQVEQDDEDRLEIDLSEFDLGDETNDELTEPAPAVDHLSIDLDETNSSEHDDLAEFSLDTNLSADLSSMEFEALPDEAEEVEELDLGDDNIHEIDEAETKLDLAAAYIDMDDQDGAIGILKEVLIDGNEAQQKRAQELLDSIS